MSNLSKEAKAILRDCRQSDGSLTAIAMSGGFRVTIQGCEDRVEQPGTKLRAAVDELAAAGLITGGSGGLMFRLTTLGLTPTPWWSCVLTAVKFVLANAWKLLMALLGRL